MARPARRGRHARTHDGDRDPYLTTGNPEAFLRALHLQVALAPEPTDVRADLLLVLVDALRSDQRVACPAREPSHRSVACASTSGASAAAASARSSPGS